MDRAGILLVCVTLLLVLGVLMVYSAHATSDGADDQLLYLKRHLMAVLVGAGAMWLALRIHPTYWQHPWVVAVVLVVALCLLVGVLIPGVGTMYNGARRWLRFGGMGLQPSEFAKFAALIWLAWILGRHPAGKRWWLTYLGALAVLVLLAGLIVLQPDYGTAALILAVGLAVCFARGVPWLHLVVTILLAVVPATALVLQKEYRRVRIENWIKAIKDPLTADHHTRQNILSFGTGGGLGTGVGQGRQKLHFLPEADTDSIFAIIGEELGLLGTLGVLSVFAMILWTGTRIAWTEPDPYLSLLAFGITCQFVAQAVMNMGVATALLPNKGIALPLVSYGGSNLCFSLFSMGVLIGIARRSSPLLADDPHRGLSVVVAPGG